MLTTNSREHVGAKLWIICFSEYKFHWTMYAHDKIDHKDQTEYQVCFVLSTIEIHNCFHHIKIVKGNFDVPSSPRKR